MSDCGGIVDASPANTSNSITAGTLSSVNQGARSGVTPLVADRVLPRRMFKEHRGSKACASQPGKRAQSDMADGIAKAARFGLPRSDAGVSKCASGSN